MIEGSLSRRYAKALFQLAQKEEREEEVGEEIERFVAAYTSPSLMKVLNNPAFGVRNRKNIAIRVAQVLELSQLGVHFLSLLLDRDRLSILPSIVSRYRRLLDEAKGRVEAGVVCAAPLERVMIEKVRAALKGISGKEVVLREQIDPGLIGGVVVQLEGRIYDGSVRAQLEMMKRRIERGY